MIREVSAMARRFANIVALGVALAILLAPQGGPRAQTAGSPLIKIPPAQLPPPTVASPTASATGPTPAAPAPTTAPMAPAPRALLPTAVQVLHDPQGAGLAMYGALTGKAASATAILLSIFANSEAFDPTPTLLLVFADDSDRRAQALFTATVHGARVIGVAVAALGNSGGDVTVFYDNDDAFAASFPRMQQALAQSGGV